MFLDAELSWLIQTSLITNALPHRRLNAIENQLANLASRWRTPGPIVPECELRMSASTRDRLLEWVEECEEAGEDMRARILIYASGAVAENTVPDRLIRVQLVR